jgi:hypothetical protein
MKTIIAVLFGFLALNSSAQVIGDNPTNTAPPGVTNASPAAPGNAMLTDPEVAAWLQDATPEGATLSGPPDDTWVWTNAFWDGSEPVGPYSGSLMHVSPLAEGWHQHYFSLASLALPVNPGDWLIAYVYLSRTNTPAAVALRWLVGAANAQGPAAWNAGVFWCAANVLTNNADTNAFYAGPLPAAGQWARLSVPAAALGPGARLAQGLSFAILDGTAAWGLAGKVVPYTAGNGAAAPPGAGPGVGEPLVLSGYCVNPAPGVAGWWQGQNSPADFLGLDNGQWQGTSGYMAGEVGQAFYLNSAGADVRVPASATLNVGTNYGFTVETWICPYDLGNRPIVEWNYDNNGYTSYGAHFWTSQPPPCGSGTGCLFANLIDSGGGSHYVASAAGLVSAGVWSHVALTYNQITGYGCIYLNGSLVAATYVGTFTPQTSYDLYFGARVCGAGEAWWYGGIDEVSLYKCVLSAAQIQAIYNAGSAGKCTSAPASVSPPPGLAGWWQGQNSPADYLNQDNGYWQGTAAYMTGEVGQAFYLDGTDADVLVPASPALNAGTDFTVET